MMRISHAAFGLWLFGLAGGVAVPAVAQATEQSALEVSVNIAPQPLRQALTRFAQQTGVQLLFTESEVPLDVLSQGLVGTYTLERALEALLAPTALRAQFIDSRTIAIRAGTLAGARSGDTASTLKPTAGPQEDTVRLAQANVDPQSADAAGAEGSRGIEEVTVTGTRQQLYSSKVVTSGVLGDKDPFDVPFSIASYSSELAKLQNAYTPNEILKNDPSVQNPGLDIYPNDVLIRGFRAAAGGVRRDGLYGSDVGDAPIEAFERIEVVKGVAGFLYGFAQPGGVQNYVTKRPTRDPFSALELGYRSGSGRYAHVEASGPIAGERLGYRVNLAREDQGDFTHRGDILRNMAAASFDVKLTDALLLRVEGTYQDRDQAGEFGLPRAIGDLEPPEYDSHKSLVAPWMRSRFTSAGAGLRLEYQVSGDWKLIAQGRRDEAHARLGFGFVSSIAQNGDFTEDLGSLPRNTIRNESTISQLMVLGKARTGFLTHELALGAFRRHGSHQFNLADGGTFIEVSGNLFDLSYGPAPDIADVTHTPLRRESPSETHWFIGDTISLGDRWQLLGGLRHVEAKFSQVNFVAGTSSVDEAKKSSPSAAVIFKPDDTVRLYASYARSLQQGFRSPCGGGVNIVNPCELQAPIEARQTEIGAKARVASSLDVGLALYRIELPSDYLDPDTLVYGRYGRQLNRGVELTAVGNVLPNLAIVAGLGYLDAERKRNVNPDLNGRNVPGLSRWTGNLFVNYGIGSIPGLTLNAGAYYVGARDFDALNTTGVSGYTRVDVGAQYGTSLAQLPLKLRLNVRNLTDRFYWESAWDELYTAGNGRTYGISAELQLR